MNPKNSKINRVHTVAELQNAVENTIAVLATGFLNNISNSKLRASIKKDNQNRLVLYRQLVRFVFRLIFLCIAEEKDLLFSSGTPKDSKLRYAKDYSIQRLRQRQTDEYLPDQEEIWNGMQCIMEKLQHGCPSLNLPAIPSFLWAACSSLTKAKCTNSYIIKAIQTLSYSSSSMTAPLIRWQDIAAEDLGRIYESLLELHLEIDTKQWVVNLSTKTGHQRKSTGSYYTPHSLIQCLLRATLEPTINRTIKGKKTPGEAILQLRVCDPSCGSGVFLIAAARHLSRRLAQIRSGIQDPSSDIRQQAMRDVIQHCIYGVDLNPMSVELCAISLWMEMNDSVESFSALHSNIRCGNALLGIRPEQIKDGIRPDFFTLVKNHDDKAVRNRIASKNRTEYKNKKSDKLPDTDLKKSVLSDVILAATLWPKTKTENWEKASPTQNVFSAISEGKTCSETMKYVDQLKRKHHFFHWNLSFPHVFANGGVDVVIGNPPYLDSEFLTKKLPYERTAITQLYLSARGNWDIYIPFTELGIRLLKPGGLHAFVTPNKILGADYSASLHQESFFVHQLKEIHDFSHLSLFDGASVAVVIVVTEKTAAKPNENISFYQYKSNPETVSAHTTTTLSQLQKLPAGFISFPITSPEPELISWIDHNTSFLDIAHVSDGATAGEAYKIQPLVHAGTNTDWNKDDQIKLVNTGTIDPFVLLWNQKTISYLGFKGVCPVIDANVFQQKFPRRYQQAMNENIVMAGMSKRLEAAVAPKGVLCGKSAVLLQPKPEICPYALTVLLNSQAFVNLYQGLFAMRGMNGSSLNIGPRQIEKLPSPAPKYLQKYEGTVPPKSKISSATTIYDRLSMLGISLHRHQDQNILELAEQTVRSIMNHSHSKRQD